MDTNEVFIRLAGNYEIDLDTGKQLSLGDEVKLSLTASVVKSEDKDNQDGTKDVIFVLKSADVVELKKA